ncbi:Fc.00g054630.m01.CDS01 [Cosmosporella sp. VM-42]
MRWLHAFVFSALASLGSAAAIVRDEPAEYDAIIIGGGPAGLAALSGLARVRRNALLIDSGVYRNALTRHMHDVLGFDGVTPAYYRFGARTQLSHYDTVTMTNGTVTKIEPLQNNTKFSVSADYPGNQKKTFTARKVVLATGLRDLLPNTPGIKENWGHGIYWCPWCDGQAMSMQISHWA